MRRPNFAVILIAAAAVAALAAPAAAQELGASVRIVPVPDGATFLVDGVSYSHAVSMIWPVGTKHSLAGYLGAIDTFNTTFDFTQWEANGQALPGGRIINVTADPAIKEYRAIFQTKYALTISFFDCPDCDTPVCEQARKEQNPVPTQCLSPGTVYVDSEKVLADKKVFFSVGSTVRLTAVPNDNYVFAGWVPGENQTITGYFNTVTMKSPTAVHPRFVFARRITLTTDPPGLDLLADRSKVSTPAPLDWGIHTTHTLGPVTPQQDKDGKWWAFQSWSTGAAAIHSYEVDQSTTPTFVTAKFVPVAVTQVSSLPPGLGLKVDGRDNWVSFNFPWGIGETHKLEAPAELTDELGRTYKFKSWSDGGAASHSFTVPADAEGTGVRVIATYEAMARLLVNSSMAGLRVSIDDVECTTPCDVKRDVNSKVRVKAPGTISMGENVRSDFSGWRGTGTAAVEWAGTLGSDPVTITADYHLMNRLQASADPPAGVQWRVTPESEDGYYDTKTAVTIGVTALAGYRFRGWAGDLTGNTPTGLLAMSAPRTVRAMLDRIPYIGTAGVTNAAGPTPRGVVAPGSVASIFGVNLANNLVVGPETPLAQTLGGLTVRLGDRFLPLFFVSPAQINLQLPSDLGEGTQVLTVSLAGAPDVRTSFSVVRAAPGIFMQAANAELYVVAAHEDGSPVTLDSPARKGELLSIFGTGFGPTTNRPRPEGFPVPAGELFTIADPVSVQVGDFTIEASTAFASAGRVGVDVARFRLGDDVASGKLSLRLTINGQDSNSALLPVE